MPIHLHPRPVRAMRHRVAGSTSLRAAVASTFWPAVISCGILIGFYLHLTRGVYVDWSGWQTIPVGAQS